MAQLWSAQTLLLQAAMQERHVAQQQRAAAEQATAAAVREQQRLSQLQVTLSLKSMHGWWHELLELQPAGVAI
jgi:Tfp pilus assembly protein PilE